MASELMSRHVIGANTAIFTALDRFCADRLVSLKNASAPRWIASRGDQKHFLISSVVKEKLHYSGSRKLAKIEFGSRSFCCALGFDAPDLLPGNQEIDVDAAFLTVALFELAPRPKATPFEIRNIVEVADRASDLKYSGHDYELISRLFPVCRIIELSNCGENSIWKIFFLVCVNEVEFGDSWIEADLADTLRSVCELDAEKIPYKILCQTIFNGDGGSFYLSLYRCIEALYAFSAAQKLVRALDIRADWAAVAEALENELGWHPREDSSLEKLLKLADPNDLRAVLAALGESTDGKTPEDIIRHASRGIYKLRNALVHFRPLHHKTDVDTYDWNALCKAMVGIICYVYGHIFSQT